MRVRPAIAGLRRCFVACLATLLFAPAVWFVAMAVPMSIAQWGSSRDIGMFGVVVLPFAALATLGLAPVCGDWTMRGVEWVLAWCGLIGEPEESREPDAKSDGRSS